jgi:endonuclease YncB( thermonuclease family)
VRFNGGPRARVRLLGIRLPARRCGGVGAARLRALAPPGKSVTVITDPRAKARDAHGRRLAYVSRSRRDVGRRLIANGWARLANGSAGISRRATYEAAQRRAKQRHAGLWGCG